ncbi:MAG: hypothetical protein HKN47_10990 [Pirellulaceae bacterium]|nr:hypothetical protein [Pirellulaceae bacterium]
MEREQSFETDPIQHGHAVDPSSDADGLQQQREEINDLLQSADEHFDSITNLFSHGYLQQNFQTGGQ